MFNCMADMIGTGRMNVSGGAGTLTVPKAIREQFGAEKGDGVTVVYFETDDGDLIIKPKAEVSI